MPIQYHEQEQIFHLKSSKMSYMLQIVKGYVAHLYWGKAIRHENFSKPIRYIDRPFSPNINSGDNSFSLDNLPQEYPSYGHSDFRLPAYQVAQENGSTIMNLQYHSYVIYKGKPQLDGLPSTYVEQEDEAETLEITLIDSLTSLKVVLTYTVYTEMNALTRSVKFMNEGTSSLKLLKAASMSVDFSDDNFELLQLSGTWANERNVVQRPLTVGSQGIESRRGASSHQQNPFIALLRKGSNEDVGDVYGFSLVYSGSFAAQVEVDQYHTSRVSMGINSFDFSWLLEQGESFQTPEVVMVYSGQGLGEMSRTYHRLYRTRLCRGKYRDQSRPILINNWEATYFDFTADKIESIAKKGKELGLELFVLDDGWFGHRNNDKTSLGDWVVDTNKLPNGLEDLVNRVTALDMAFGLWFEPEMISEESDLYTAHPDWCLQVPHRNRSTGRNQLVLDFSRQEVCEYIISSVSNILSSAPISYVKWDMNRHMTEVGSLALPPERQRETAHRYMLGLYSVLETITSTFPDVLFESCSGGGGRFDPGMLYYMPQTWTSDNTDAVCRLKIQYGTSIVYPISAMGAHVSAVPNHQVHRMTSLKMRGDVALSGNFGYELDLTKFTVEEQEEVKKQVKFYKEQRHLIQFGDYYRLLSPFEGNMAAWMFVSDNQEEALVMYFQVLDTPNASWNTLKLKGLNPEYDYEVDGLDTVYGGDSLMYAGINVPWLSGDFQSVVWKLTRRN